MSKYCPFLAFLEQFFFRFLKIGDPIFQGLVDPGHPYLEYNHAPVYSEGFVEVEEDEVPGDDLDLHIFSFHRILGFYGNIVVQILENRENPDRIVVPRPIKTLAKRDQEVLVVAGLGTLLK